MLLGNKQVFVASFPFQNQAFSALLSPSGTCPIFSGNLLNWLHSVRYITLLLDIVLGWKSLLGLNPLAYFSEIQKYNIKMFIGLVTADVDILVFAIKVVDKCVLSMKEDWRKNYFKPKNNWLLFQQDSFLFTLFTPGAGGGWIWTPKLNFMIQLSHKQRYLGWPQPTRLFSFPTICSRCQWRLDLNPWA